MSNVSSIKDEMKASQGKNVQSLKSKEHQTHERKERLVNQEVPGAVVAFYTYMSSNFPSDVANPHHVLIFDHVRTNNGNGYHSSTGVFIAPETGVYVLIWTFRNGDGGKHSTQLMINSDEWGKIHSRISNGSLQSTGCVVAHVNKGNDVFAKTSDSSSGYIYSNSYDRLLTPDVLAPGQVVAFYAYISATLPANVATPHHVLIFDHVRTNIGNGYHPSTGVFIAPETGVYAFIWNFQNGGGCVHSTQLMINSEEWGIIYSHTASITWTQSTGSVVAHVNKGDDVFMKTSDSSSGIIISNNFGKTLFSGWKIN